MSSNVLHLYLEFQVFCITNKHLIVGVVETSSTWKVIIKVLSAGTPSAIYEIWQNCSKNNQNVIHACQ